MPILRRCSLLLSLLILPHFSSQVYVKEMCTTSHIWLEPSDDRMELARIPGPKSGCFTTYKNQTIIDRYCLGSQTTTRVALSPRGLRSDLHTIFIVHCPETTADDIAEPLSASLKASSNQIIEITVQEQQRLILSSKLIVADCFLFAAEHQTLQYQLVDSRGCPNDEFVSSFEEVNFGSRRRFRAKLTSLPVPFSSPQLQCSLALCGAECAVPCSEGRAEWTPSSTKILLSTSLPASSDVSPLRTADCSWWLQRLLLLLLTFVLLCSTLFLVYTAYRNCPWTLQEIREMLRFEKPKKRGLLHIVHPIDHFDSPPVITKRLASLKNTPVDDSDSSFASVSSENSKQATIQSSSLNLADYLTSGFMENLPEPPNVPLSKLAGMVRKTKPGEAGQSREKEIIYANIKKLKLPTPLQRTVSKGSTSKEDAPPPLTTANLQKHDEIQTAIMMTFKTFESDTPILIGKERRKTPSTVHKDNEETSC